MEGGHTGEAHCQQVTPHGATVAVDATAERRRQPTHQQTHRPFHGVAAGTAPLGRLELAARPPAARRQTTQSVRVSLACRGGPPNALPPRACGGRRGLPAVRSGPAGGGAAAHTAAGRPRRAAGAAWRRPPGRADASTLAAGALLAAPAKTAAVGTRRAGAPRARRHPQWGFVRGADGSAARARREMCLAVWVVAAESTYELSGGTGRPIDTRCSADRGSVTPYCAYRTVRGLQVTELRFQ